MARVPIVSSMNGTVLELLVVVGDHVEEGSELVIIEAMKMEIPVESPGPGTVAEVLVEAGQKVEEGDALLMLEAQS